MKSMVLILLTAVIVLVQLGRQAMAAGRITSVRENDTTAESRTHPLVLLIGSLLSLLALYSLLRHLPVDVEGTWSVFFHVGFLCLWLVVTGRAHASGGGRNR